MGRLWGLGAVPACLVPGPGVDSGQGCRFALRKSWTRRGSECGPWVTGEIEQLCQCGPS